jgi:hypothetical protein
MLKMIVSRGEFPSLEEICSLFKKSIGRGKDKAAASLQLEQLEQKVVVWNPDLEFFDDELLGLIDKEASVAYNTCHLQIGMGTDDDMNALAKYTERAIAHIKRLRANHAGADGVCARFKYIMTSRKADFPPIPLCTAFVQGSVLSVLGKLKGGIDFVSLQSS